MAPTYAQEQDKDAIKIAVSDTIVGDEDKAEEGFNISVNIGDDESSADEKLRNAANKLSKVFGKEFGEEMKLELDGMSNAEKEKVIIPMQINMYIAQTCPTIQIYINLICHITA